MKKIVVGLLAHVDAGKTTCSESLLAASGQLRKAGRVDHQDTFLDYDSQERRRGITIYAKQARLHAAHSEIVLLDTPGHVDFSAEMERTLSVLDYALLILSSRELVQAHTRTIWKLLEQAHIPIFLFVNKMDLSLRSRAELLADLQRELSPQIADWDSPQEELALLDDQLLACFEERGRLSDEEIAQAIARRSFSLAAFGSALHQEGIDSLLEMLDRMTAAKQYPAEFGARVFKISRDLQGSRLTHIRITGGSLKAREMIAGEKIDQIRFYHGNTFTTQLSAEAGDLCTLKGPLHLQAGQGLGFEQTEASAPAGCLSCQMILPDHIDAFAFSRQLAELQEEDPSLQFTYHQENSRISVSLMGEVQTEVLQQLILDRFQVPVSFSAAEVEYRETILDPVEGVGHFEPLRHYAEVHLMLAPLPAGNGVEIDTDCPMDVLKPQWQSQILNALDSASLRGVLTGSLLTDLRITLISGRGSVAHTGGQDFREAALRALRQGLLQSRCVLLEPYGSYELQVPQETFSRACYDLEQRHASYETAVRPDGSEILTGEGPIRLLQNYAAEVAAYSRGTGSFFLSFTGYRPSRDQEKLTAESGYDPLSDLTQPAYSVFCQHGAGFNVPWDHVTEYMHVPLRSSAPAESAPARHTGLKVSDAELETIMNRLYPKKEKPAEPTPRSYAPASAAVKAAPVLPKILIVDGYNMIFSWDELKDEARQDLAAAREKLIAMLAEYSFHYNGRIVLVFDAYLVKDSIGSSMHADHLEIIYTRCGETADSYIEGRIEQLSRKYQVTVATSDQLEQLAVLQHGALRCPARELYQQIIAATRTSLSKSNASLHSGSYPLKDLKKKFEQK